MGRNAAIRRRGFILRDHGRGGGAVQPANTALVHRSAAGSGFGHCGRHKRARSRITRLYHGFGQHRVRLVAWPASGPRISVPSRLLQQLSCVLDQELSVVMAAQLNAAAGGRVVHRTPGSVVGEDTPVLHLSGAVKVSVIGGSCARIAQTLVLGWIRRHIRQTCLARCGKC